MFADLEEHLLRRLIKAEADGRPLTHRQLAHQVRGSSFDDLWAQGRIEVKGKEGVMCCEVTPDSEYVASHSGKHWIACLDADRRSEPRPPAPPSRTIAMF